MVHAIHINGSLDARQELPLPTGVRSRSAGGIMAMDEYEEKLNAFMQANGIEGVFLSTAPVAFAACNEP
ncbi:MAG TPA: hypothetical protein DIT01_10035 [Lentisphaeria bacterium]|nr:hypothetical protein [Lentisphaeria bacterium]